MSRIIGLTGPTGSGKSVAATIAENMGIKVVDCDIIARKAVEKGTSGLNALVNVFSSEILNPDGTLNRKELARKAFSSKENTELLNKTIFPFITELVKNEIDRDTVLLDAPTLFESGLDSICYKTLAVLANTDTRLERIINRDNILKEDALLRISAGKSDEFYKEKADYILYNNREIGKFEKEISNIFSKLTEE